MTEGAASYSFTAVLIAQNDGGQPGDASAELAQARTLDLLTDVIGEVGDRDQGDHYLFEAFADELNLEVSVDVSSAARVGVEVLGPDGNRIVFFRVQPGVTTTETFETTTGETYRLLLTEGRAIYTMSLS